MTNLAHSLQASAGSYPHRIALRQGDVLFTYAQLNGEVARAAAWLADKGVRPGDRVAIILTFAVTRRLPRRPVRSRGIYGDRAELRQRP